MAPDGAGGGASRPIALSCRCVRHTGSTHGTHSRVRCPWPRAGAVCARMRRGGSLCSRVPWLLGRGDNNLMQRYTDPWTPHCCGCTTRCRFIFIYSRPAPRRGRVEVPRPDAREVERFDFRCHMPLIIKSRGSDAGRGDRLVIAGPLVPSTSRPPAAANSTACTGVVHIVRHRSLNVGALHASCT